MHRGQQGGYYIDPVTDYVQPNPLVVLGPSFFHTNLAFVGGGAQGEPTVEMARNSAQTKADTAIAKSRAQVLVIRGSI